ncbi:c-type cytochrome [Methylomarinum vadi]|uniref:c-type cytochrome n=1 Tax=Methylomarinum vadi TaxID=438855 RepID=UPI0004DED3A4|nr:hypothetical protein [Methylomarinum vadi]
MKLLLASILLIGISSMASAEVAPQLIALSCRNCHSGIGMAIPNLHALSAEQIRGRLLDFKSGRRKSTVMGRLARGFSDQEIQAVAEYLAAER